MSPKIVDLSAFLMRAKVAAYAGDGVHAPSCRTASVDLPYQEGHYTYLDTYLGVKKFIGEEAVWYDQRPLWGMNYYGWMTVPEAPEGFAAFLKAALRQLPPDAPYRGPEHFVEGDFSYRCKWQGSIPRFNGREVIYHKGHKVYECIFHGGEIH